jgi:hypothetical protein
MQSHNPQFIRSDSCSQPGSHEVLTNSTTEESVLLTRLASEVLDWTDSSWVVGLIKSGDATCITAVFCLDSDAAVRRSYLECVCAETLRGESGTGGGMPLLHKAARVVCPIWGDCGVDAVLGLGPRKNNRRYSATDFAMVRELCSRFGSLLREIRAPGALPERNRGAGAVQ